MRPAQWSNAARVFVALTALVVITQSVSLVLRASSGKSDVGVFYRSARLLSEGAGADFYTERDTATGWYRTIPPAGLVIFQPLARLNRTAAGCIWAVLNVAFLVTAVLALGAYITCIDYERQYYQDAFPWIVGVLALLASGSIQVGQFSLLFVACWIFSLAALARGRSSWAGLSLALPSVIKLYPALMLAVPLAGCRRRRASVIAFFFLGVLVFGAIVPFVALGPRAWEVTESFLLNAILGGEGGVARYTLLGAGSASNQGLDSVLLRYLTDSPAFHSRYRSVPHLALDRQVVLQLANWLRAAILITTIAAVVRSRWGLDRYPLNALMHFAALWSATLYVILPETKARYAVYTVLAFLPMCMLASRARAEGNRTAFVAWSGTIMLCLAMVLQAFPTWVHAFGIGYVGQLALWAFNLKQTAYIRATSESGR